MKLAFVTVLAIALLPCYAIADFTSDSAPGWTELSSPAIAEIPQAPPNGTPVNNRTSTSGVARGGACKQTDKQTNQLLTALVPIKGSESLTTAEHPVFWFYIPDASEDIQSIEFSVHDRDNKTTLYLTSLQLTKTPGVIGIPLPQSSESLKLKESYQWRLMVKCDPKETPGNELALDGWVTRVQQSPNPWYDELTNLAKRYLSEPQNPEVKKAWAELLKSVGLEGLAQAPLVSSVSNPKND